LPREDHGSILTTAIERGCNYLMPKLISDFKLVKKEKKLRFSADYFFVKFSRLNLNRKNIKIYLKKK
jgi:hypothetical protein